MKKNKFTFFILLSLVFISCSSVFDKPSGRISIITPNSESTRALLSDYTKEDVKNFSIAITSLSSNKKVFERIASVGEVIDVDDLNPEKYSVTLKALNLDEECLAYGATEVEVFAGETSKATISMKFNILSQVNKIIVSNNPKKTEYTIGESFSSEGLELTAEFKNGYSRLLTSDEYICYPADKDSIQQCNDNLLVSVKTADETSCSIDSDKTETDSTKADKTETDKTDAVSYDFQIPLTINIDSPKISVQPVDTAINQESTGAISLVTLYCEATCLDFSDVISFKWYESSKEDMSDKKEVDLTQNKEEKTGDSFKFKSSLILNLTSSEDKYYQCVVTNTNENVNGIKTSSVTSNIIKTSTSIESPTTPTEPSTDINPTIEYSSQKIAAYTGSCALTVKTEYTSESLTYEWYKNGELQEGAKEMKYEVSELSETSCFYCCVTDTSNGNKTSTEKVCVEVTPWIFSLKDSSGSGVQVDSCLQGETTYTISVTNESDTSTVISVQANIGEYKEEENGVGNFTTPAQTSEQQNVEFTVSVGNHVDKYSYSIVSSGTFLATFNYQNELLQNQTQAVSTGNTVSEPGEINLTDFVFGGWYTEPECTNIFDFSTEVCSDIVLYAKWTECVITSLSAKFVNSNGYIIANEGIPTTSDFEVVGMYDNGEKVLGTDEYSVACDIEYVGTVSATITYKKDESIATSVDVPFKYVSNEKVESNSEDCTIAALTGSTTINVVVTTPSGKLSNGTTVEDKISYQWYSGTSKIEGATNSSYEVSVLSETNKYYCEVDVTPGEYSTSVEGTTFACRSNDITVNVTPWTMKLTDTTNSNSQVVSSGESVTLTADSKYSISFENDAADAAAISIANNPSLVTWTLSSSTFTTMTNETSGWTFTAPSEQTEAQDCTFTASYNNLQFGIFTATVLASATPATTYTANTFTELESIIENDIGTGKGTVIISSDMTSTTNSTISVGGDVSIVSNESTSVTITRGAELSGSGLFTLSTDASLSIGETGGSIIIDGGYGTVSASAVLIKSAKANLTIGENCTLQNNRNESTSATGSAIIFTGGSSYTLTINGTITSNYCANNGGGIYIEGDSTTERCIVILKNCSISDNETSKNGGGMYIKNADVTISNSSLLGNKATTTSSSGVGDGGAIFYTGSANGSCIINESSVIGSTDNPNTSGENGGGIYINTGTVTLEKGTVSDNTAANSGQNIYCTKDGIYYLGTTKETSEAAIAFDDSQSI